MLIQPAFQTRDLTLSETGHTRNPSREFAILLFRLCSDEMGNFQRPCDRRGNKAVCSGDDDAKILAQHVLLYQFARSGGDEWQDSRLHELAVPGIELASRMAR